MSKSLSATSFEASKSTSMKTCQSRSVNKNIKRNQYDPNITESEEEDTSPMVKLAVVLTNCGVPGGVRRRPIDDTPSVQLVKSSSNINDAELDLNEKEQSSVVTSSSAAIPSITNNSVQSQLNDGQQQIIVVSSTEIDWWRREEIWISVMFAALAIFFGGIAIKYFMYN